MPAWVQQKGVAALLVLVVILAYWNSLGAPFLFDDEVAVTKNITIRHLNLDTFSPPSDGSTTTGRPLLNLSYAVNYALSGEQVWSYHLFNIALHALSVLYVLGIARGTLTSPVLKKHVGVFAPALSALIALLWALHPLNTETVICVAQRTEGLCGFFFLLTLFAYIKAQKAERNATRWQVLSVSACLAGMASKEVMATAPLMVLLYDRTFLAGSFSAALSQRWRTYAALAGTWLLLVLIVALEGCSRGQAAGFGIGVSAWDYLLTQCEALVLYLKLSFWPHPLVLDYGTALVSSLAVVWWQGLLILGLLGVSTWALVKKPVLGFAGAWFFIILAPSSSLIPLVTQTIAEHRMYLPLLSVIFVVTIVLCSRLGKAGLYVLSAVALLFLGLTVQRTLSFRDAETVWEATIRDYPTSARAHNNLAGAYQDKGAFDKANAEYARAIELQPDYIMAHYNWGVALLAQNRVGDSIREFEQSLRLSPKHTDAQVNLGNALVRANRAQESLAYFQSALQAKPAGDVHYNLAIALLALSRVEEATTHLREALRLDPALAAAHFQLALLAQQHGEMAEAEKRFSEGLRLSPEDAEAHMNLAMLLVQTERFEAAADHFRAVTRLQPKNAEAFANLGNVQLVRGQVREAITCYEEALRLQPENERIRQNLQVARESNK